MDMLDVSKCFASSSVAGMQSAWWQNVWSFGIDGCRHFNVFECVPWFASVGFDQFWGQATLALQLSDCNEELLEQQAQGWDCECLKARSFWRCDSIVALHYFFLYVSMTFVDLLIQCYSQCSDMWKWWWWRESWPFHQESQVISKAHRVADVT